MLSMRLSLRSTAHHFLLAPVLRLPGCLSVTARNRNPPGSQSAQFSAQIKWQWKSSRAHIKWQWARVYLFRLAFHFLRLTITANEITHIGSPVTKPPILLFLIRKSREKSPSVTIALLHACVVSLIAQLRMVIIPLTCGNVVYTLPFTVWIYS